MLIVILAEEADRPAATQVARLCSARGLPALVYTPASVTVPEASRADAVVVVCSAASIHSAWLEAQAQSADGLGKRLVLVALRGIEPADLGGEPFVWLDDEDGVIALIHAALRGETMEAGGETLSEMAGEVGAPEAERSADVSPKASVSPPVAPSPVVPAPGSAATVRPEPGAATMAAIAALAEKAKHEAAAVSAAPAPKAVAPVASVAAPVAMPTPMVAPPRPAPPQPAPAPAPAATAAPAPVSASVSMAAPTPPPAPSPSPTAVTPPASAVPIGGVPGTGGLSISDLSSLRGTIGAGGDGSQAPDMVLDAAPGPMTAPASPMRKKTSGHGAARTAANSEPTRSGGRGIVSMLAVVIAAGGLSYAFREQIVAVLPELAKTAEKLLAVLGLTKGAMPPVPGLSAAAEVRTDLVDCSVFAPPAAGKGARFMVQVFLHLVEQEERVAFLAVTMDDSAKLRGRQTLQVPIARGQRVRVELDGQGVKVDEAVQELVWRGEPNVAAFSCAMPADFAGDVAHPVTRVFVDDFPVGRVLFQVKVEEAARSRGPAPKPELAGLGARRYRTAFLSYASPDRAEVLKRAQALRVANIDFFQDVLSLEPGERYEQRIYERIGEADVFMLFWSRHARASKWVSAEIDYARACQTKNPQALPDIVPVVLEDPRDAPPPERLGDRHFNDTIAALISYEERRPKGSGGFLSRWFGRG